MPGSVSVATSSLLGFLLVLIRIGGVFVFVPIPGLKTGADMARIIFTLAVSVALYPQWPQVSGDVSAGLFTLWLFSEAALGSTIGLAVSFLTESFAVGAQVMGLQAGYAYASTIDPGTQADSSVLVVFSQLAAGTIFFASGLHREVILILVRTLKIYPPGSFSLSRGLVEQILEAGSLMFSTGLRLALPVIAVLILVDISLALLGRVNAHLQLLTLSFPIKMLVGLFLLAWTTLLFPAVFRGESGVLMSLVQRLLAH
ncbi:MAG: flagellar biosynthetic protein FliR [Bryobacteraceae bacterium]